MKRLPRIPLAVAVLAGSGFGRSPKTGTWRTTTTSSSQAATSRSASRPWRSTTSTGTASSMPGLADLNRDGAADLLYSIKGAHRLFLGRPDRPRLRRRYPAPRRLRLVPRRRELPRLQPGRAARRAHRELRRPGPPRRERQQVPPPPLRLRGRRDQRPPPPGRRRRVPPRPRDPLPGRLYQRDRRFGRQPRRLPRRLLRERLRQGRDVPEPGRRRRGGRDGRVRSEGLARELGDERRVRRLQRRRPPGPLRHLHPQAVVLPGLQHALAQGPGRAGVRAVILR